jgi:ABC-type sugar transport system ATPase subunit
VASVAFLGVSKRFGSVVAVAELTLEVADGEFMVLVGPSGSGKTTALRMLAGLEAVQEGQIEIGDRVVNHVSPRDRDVAMVFQDYALYPQMTVYDNMAFGLRRRRLPKSEIERRVTGTSEVLGLGELLERRPRQLSGGQQQRVALGRALVREPQVLLMDEPLSNLDAQLRAQARGEIKRLQEEVGTTTVYVTHDQVEAMTLGDRIAVMNAGRLEQAGTPDELYERPGNVFVGGFIGSPAMSFLPWEEALLGVRPEHVRAWSDDAGLLGPIPGQVAYVEALGRETFVGVETARGYRLVAAVEGWASVRPGDEVRLGLVREGLRRFDPADGTALRSS